MKATEKTSTVPQSQPVGGTAISRKAVFVSVTKALSGTAPDIVPGMPLRDIARGFWFVNDSKINQCELLVAIEKGIVRGTWKIDTSYGWHQMTATAIPTRNVKYVVVEPGRKYCKVANEVLRKLKGTKSTAIGIRMYGPVRYNF